MDDERAATIAERHLCEHTPLKAPKGQSYSPPYGSYPAPPRPSPTRPHLNDISSEAAVGDVLCNELDPVDVQSVHVKVVVRRRCNDVVVNC